MPERSKIILREATVYVAIGLLAVANVMLLRQNRSLAQPAPRLSLREIFPVVTGVGLDGQVLRFDVRVNQTRKMLILFSPKCSYCMASLPYYQKAADLANGDFEIVWLSIDPLAELLTFARRHDISEPIVSEVSYASARAIDLNRVPQTIIVDTDGTISGIWRGVVLEPMWREIGECVRLGC